MSLFDWLSIAILILIHLAITKAPVVFGGHNLIAENGTILAESEKYKCGITYTDIDLERLVGDRRKATTFVTENPVDDDYLEIDFELDEAPLMMTRNIDASPFIPADPKKWAERCEEILTIQAMGLKKRLEHTNCNHACTNA